MTNNLNTSDAASGGGEIKLTKKEKKAIDDLQKLVSRWPKSLWLFNNGTMYVMKMGKDGKKVFHPKTGGIDQDYCVCTINGIHSEGGDW